MHPPTHACTTVSSTTHTGTRMTLRASHHVSLLLPRRDTTSAPHQHSRVTGHPTCDTVSCTSMLPCTSPHSCMHAHDTAPQRCSPLLCPHTSSWTHARMHTSTGMHACMYPYVDASAPCTHIHLVPSCHERVDMPTHTPTHACGCAWTCTQMHHTKDQGDMTRDWEG